jgi:integrase
VELYYTLGQQHKLPEYVSEIPSISEGFAQLIAERKMYGSISKQSTIDCYRFAQEFLIDTIGDIRIHQISPVHKTRIETNLQRKGWSKNTINIRSRNIMQFLRWCVEQRLITTLPFHLKQISVQKKEKAWIAPEQFEQITDKMNPVYKAYAMVAYHTGLRLREVNTDPNDKAYNGLYHTLEQMDGLWKMKVFGKQGIIADIILPQNIKPYYDTMIANRRHPSNVSKAFRIAARSLGYSYCFHDTRHSFCSNQSLQHQDAFLLKLKMRHSSLNTTQTYLNDTVLGWIKQVESEKYNA